jgi:hypothetical protein
MKIITALLACGLLTGCVTYNVKDDGIARVAINETAYVDGTKITPLVILEDSRCPAGVQCVWAGQVRITARIELGTVTETRELTLGAPVTVADGAVELVEVWPEAKADRTHYPEDYRFGFTFKGGI